MADDPADLRLQAAQWRRAAKRHGGAVGQALTLAAESLDGKAELLERAQEDLSRLSSRPVPRGDWLQSLPE